MEFQELQPGGRRAFHTLEPRSAGTPVVSRPGWRPSEILADEALIVTLALLAARPCGSLSKSWGEGGQRLSGAHRWKGRAGPVPEGQGSSVLLDPSLMDFC